MSTPIHKHIFQNPDFKGYTLITATKSVLSKYAVLSGRATRSEYWYWTLGQTVIFLFLWMLTLVLLLTLFTFNDSHQMPPSRVFNHVLAGESPVLLWALFTLLPSLAVGCRRLHDTNKSGALLLLNLVPLAGPILLIIFFCEDSQRGTNQYGPSEKYPEDSDRAGFVPPGRIPAP